MSAVLIWIRRHWLWLTLILLAAITTLSLWPADQLPAVPGTDKTHHFIAYGVLMFPAALRKPEHWLLIAAGFVVYSGIIELIQPFVNRYGEWLDLAANSGGVVCGMLLARFVHLLFIYNAEQ
ncbi:MAG: hypothetical protein CSA79_01405 [Thiothrix nivea]|nr:MAG: hypothetical protein CSA79_01405 [Thiothrix nivea]